MVEALDLFRDWTPEMIKGIKTFGSRQSESARRRWDDMSDEDKQT